MEMISKQYCEMQEIDCEVLCKELKNSLDKSGFVEIPNFLNNSYLNKIKTNCMALIKRDPGKKAYNGSELVEEGLWELEKSDVILKLSKKILKEYTERVSKSDMRSVLNIGHGNPEYKKNLFHFDAVYLTWAIPIEMPKNKEGGSGEFWIWPNVRQFSTNNILNKFYWKIMKYKFLRNLFPHFKIKFEPGNAYLFYGFRSWHGVGDLASGAIRFNYLIHIAEVFNK